MAEFSDVVEALIEDTKSGKLEWKAMTDSGGYWHTICNEMHFQVRKSGLVEVFGNVPSISLGTSPSLVEVLEELVPLTSLDRVRDEALQTALECLRG